MLTFNQLYDLVPEEDAEGTEIVFRHPDGDSCVDKVAIETNLETGERLIVLKEGE